MGAANMTNRMHPTAPTGIGYSVRDKSRFVLGNDDAPIDNWPDQPCCCYFLALPAAAVPAVVPDVPPAAAAAAFSSSFFWVIYQTNLL